MCRQQQVAICQRVNAALFERAHQDDISLRPRHLEVAEDQEFVVHPEAHRFFVVHAVALGNLILVVRKP